MGSTHPWVGKTRFPIGIQLPMCDRAPKCDAGTEGEVGLAYCDRNLAAKKRQSNQQSLLWFRTRLGVGFYCYRSLLRDLLRLHHFHFLDRFSCLDFSI